MASCRRTRAQRCTRWFAAACRFEDRFGAEGRRRSRTRRHDDPVGHDDQGEGREVGPARSHPQRQAVRRRHPAARQARPQRPTATPRRCWRRPRTAPRQRPATAPRWCIDTYRSSRRRSPRRRPSRWQHSPRSWAAPERRSRPSFTAPPELPQRPKPKRLKPGRAHRNAVLADLPEEQRPVAERALQGGLPAVRQAVNEQNIRLKAEGKPEVPAGGLLSMAEGLLPRLRVAEWLDRADAAMADIDDLDLRDLRSVVAAGEDPMVARDESTRAVATELKAALVTKQESELAPVVRRHRCGHRRRSCHPGPQALVAATEGRRSLPVRTGHQVGDRDHREPHC